MVPAVVVVEVAAAAAAGEEEAAVVVTDLTTHFGDTNTCLTVNWH